MSSSSYSRVAAGAATILLAACATPREEAPRSVLDRFEHRIRHEVISSKAESGNSIEVEEIWGTRPSIEIGGNYLVRGRYVLATQESATLYFWLTANNWDNSGPNIDTQVLRIQKGTGHFALLHEMPGPGSFHLNLRDDESGIELADVRFGQGE